jgi:hypothetical protein
MPTKTDLKRDLGDLYRAKRAPALVEVPELQFLMIDGSGDPNTSQDFSDAIGALYTASYTIKFMLKRGEAALDFVVMPLEALWWDERGFDFTGSDHSGWHWTAMILQPDAVTQELFEEGVAKAAERRPLPAAPALRLERFEEGTCVQVLHIGPYSEERPTIERLHAFAAEQGCKLHGRHHEIYLGDPRRTAPDKLKTIIRQPVEPPAA